jgi:hypothetical protein
MQQVLSMRELCQRVYAPDVVHGVRQLKVFSGYTVDIRLQEFRKAVEGQGLTFIPFTSRQGQRLLKQMHAEVMRSACR